MKVKWYMQVLAVIFGLFGYLSDNSNTLLWAIVLALLSFENDKD